jgi:hypothetical protein
MPSVTNFPGKIGRIGRGGDPVAEDRPGMSEAVRVTARRDRLQRHRPGTPYGQGMALLHDATITPSKLDILQAWVPTRLWAAGAFGLDRVGTFRLDDPHGEVGIETFLLRTGDRLLQVPLPPRGHPPPGADHHLIATCEHSVLGTRWVYDGCGDAVWAGTLAAAILTGGSPAPVFFEEDGERVDVPPRLRVKGSGSGTDAPVVTSVDSVTDHDTLTVTRAGDLELTVARVVGSPLDGEFTLTGRAADSDELHLLATRRRR